jgi:hypothetical protein
MAAARQQRLVELQVFGGRRAVPSVGVDPGDMKLAKPIAERTEQLEPEPERPVVRPNVRNVETEARLGETLEYLRHVLHLPPEPLHDVHVLEHRLAREYADRVPARP